MAIQLEPVIAKEHFEYQITCIDSHTQGEALRLAVNGIPHLSGKDMIEKRKYFQDHYDFIRTALMDEPRGHRDMFGAILTELCMKKRLWHFLSDARRIHRYVRSWDNCGCYRSG